MSAEVSAFPGLRAESDVSPAQWLVERLWPGRILQVGSVVPDVYPAYGRLLHPARSAMPDGPDEYPLVSDRSRTRCLDRLRRPLQEIWSAGATGPARRSLTTHPCAGHSTEEQNIALAEILAGFTSRAPQSLVLPLGRIRLARVARLRPRPAPSLRLRERGLPALHRRDNSKRQPPGWMGPIPHPMVARRPHLVRIHSGRRIFHVYRQH